MKWENDLLMDEFRFVPFLSDIKVIRSPPGVVPVQLQPQLDSLLIVTCLSKFGDLSSFQGPSSGSSLVVEVATSDVPLSTKTLPIHYNYYFATM